MQVLVCLLIDVKFQRDEYFFFFSFIISYVRRQMNVTLFGIVFPKISLLKTSAVVIYMSR